MHLELLDILRCPFCGGHLDVDLSAWERREGDDIHEGILACHCCTFPVVAGIPILHLEGPVRAAADHVRAGRPDEARHAMCEVAQGEQFDDLVSSPDSTYREAVAALVPELEAAYFLHRFSDPSFIVAQAVTRAVARTVLHEGGRAIDVCGGSGHLTRSLLDLSSPAPVLTDLSFAKLWLARRFTAANCQAVCCDGNLPLPFARGSFRFALCADAFMFIWMKRQLAGEMLRLIDDGSHGGAAVVTHAHNQLVWSPSHGQPLPPAGYRQLFETVPARVFAESRLFDEVLSRAVIDLSHDDPSDRLDAEEAVVVVATVHPAVPRSHALERLDELPGEFRLNPLYAVETDAEHVRLRLRFPSAHYAEEFSASRRYLPETIVVQRASLEPSPEQRVASEVAELIRRRVLLPLPKQYY